MTSFLTLGIFWVGQQTQMNHLQHSNRNLTRIHLMFLFLVTLTPFSTGVLAEFIHFRSALLLYWLNVFLLGATLFLSWVCATRQHLIKPELPAYIPDAIQHRILITQLLYAAAAAMSFISNRLSIAFIVLVQLNHAIAPASLPAGWFGGVERRDVGSELRARPRERGARFDELYRIYKVSIAARERKSREGCRDDGRTSDYEARW